MLIETETYGTCLASHGVTHHAALVDDEAPIAGGDYVRAKVGDNWIVKQLLCGLDGRWYLHCDDALIPISRYACVPSAIHKVVAWSEMPRHRWNAHRVPDDLRADDNSLRVYRALAPELRAFLTGATWPGLEAALDAAPLPDDFNERYAAAGESFAGAPPQNPTTPSEAVLAVSQHVAGTLRFTIADPVVRPLGTRFQLIRSLVSNNAAVGSVVYDGTTQVVDLPCPSSTHYYYSRPYVNSYFGPYSPNTSGISAVPDPLTTAQVSSGAATVIYSAANSYVPASATAFDQLRCCVTSMTVAGVYEITATGRVRCSSFTATGNILVELTAGGGGTQTPPWSQTRFAVTSRDQEFVFAVGATYVTSGSGPWSARVGYVDDGSGNGISGYDMAMRVTGVRR